MKLLDRYIIRQFLAIFFALVFGLPLLFIITDLTENLDKHLARGVAFDAVGLSYLYLLPQFFLWATPIAALVATVFTIGGMTRHQEIAAAKAGGVSFYRLLVPIVGLGILLSGAALALSELVPVTMQMRAEVLGQRETRVGQMRSNFVFQTEEGRILSARRLDPVRGELVGVVIEQDANDVAPAMHGTAERAQWDPEQGNWRLEQGYVRLLGSEGEEATFSFTGLDMPGFRETPEELLADPKEPDQMRYHEMTRFIRAIERSGGDSRELQVEQAQKLALPVAVLVIVLFGAPLATSNRRGGAAFGIGISLAITLVYLLLFRVGRAVGASGGLDPMVAAWLPNAIFLAAALVLLARVRT